MYNIPTIIKIKPRGVMSNIEIGMPDSASEILLTRIFVEVPIKVQLPPKIEANERGINIFEGLCPEE
tara:strand:+ start:1550 stop:1750 length:201 start_codon:yes stop_codon:yes gene_type:complete